MYTTNSKNKKRPVCVRNLKNYFFLFPHQKVSQCEYIKSLVQDSSCPAVKEDKHEFLLLELKISAPKFCKDNQVLSINEFRADTQISSN